MPLSKPNGTLTGWKGICYVQDMNKPVVEVRELSKQYSLGATVSHDTLRDAIADGFKSIFGRNSETPRQSDDETIWALKDVSFDVKEGEVLGIIGRNGAGKSTLLKVLSRITEPTEGEVKITGRVGSLLEVGTGFHPELTGRENIYLNGAILGMKKEEIKKKFDEMVAFAEIEKFLDTPVKRYSSGMYVRLAFAVAAHFEPEILVVDEVLAVGDAQFQKRCLGKMGDVAGEGRTVLFVSHNMAAVQSLCSRAIWLDEGKIVDSGQPDEVISNYLKTSASAMTERVWDDMSTAPGNDNVRLRRACVRPEDGAAGDEITVNTPFVLEFEYWNLIPDIHLSLSLPIFNEQGVLIFATAPFHEPIWQGRPFPRGLFHSMCHVPGGLLNSGIHRVCVLIVKDGLNVIRRLDDILIFDVSDAIEARGSCGAWHGRWQGAVRPNLKWDTELLSHGDAQE
jgi:lipopolysaccharide transport system ATP-binding protein